MRRFADALERPPDMHHRPVAINATRNGALKKHCGIPEVTWYAREVENYLTKYMPQVRVACHLSTEALPVTANVRSENLKIIIEAAPDLLSGQLASGPSLVPTQDWSFYRFHSMTQAAPVAASLPV